MAQSKFDQLIYLTQECDLDPAVILAKVQELFPSFDPNDDNYNDRHLTDMKVDLYYYHRALGLPVVEVAQSIELSVTLMSKIFEGERVSLTKLVNIAQAETFALSSMKATHISMLEKTEGHTANIMFLEKAFSDVYGDRKQIDINSGFSDKTNAAKAGWTVTVHTPDKDLNKE